MNDEYLIIQHPYTKKQLEVEGIMVIKISQKKDENKDNLLNLWAICRKGKKDKRRKSNENLWDSNISKVVREMGALKGNRIQCIIMEDSST